MEAVNVVRVLFMVALVTGLCMPVHAEPIINPSQAQNLPDVVITKLQEWFTGATGTQGPVGSGNMTMNQTINLTPGSSGDLSNYYPLNGTSILTGKMDAGTWNLSNITWTALMDAANVSYVIDTNTTMKTYVDTKPVINGTYLIGWSDAWNTSYDTISNVSQTNIVINNTLVSLINTNNNTLKDHGNLTGLTDDDHNIYALVAGTRAFTGDQSMGSHKLTSVTNPSVAQDAATKNYVDAVGQAWAAWTPTLTWISGTPVGLSTVARWTRIGRVVYYSIYLDSSDSNAAAGLTITLPVAVVNRGIYPEAASVAIAGADGNTRTVPMAFIDDVSNVINFWSFPATTDGKRIALFITGFYEVA